MGFAPLPEKQERSAITRGAASATARLALDPLANR
jgi:hypothetical protein